MHKQFFLFLDIQIFIIKSISYIFKKLENRNSERFYKSVKILSDSITYYCYFRFLFVLVYRATTVRY